MFGCFINSSSSIFVLIRQMVLSTFVGPCWRLHVVNNTFWGSFCYLTFFFFLLLPFRLYPSSLFSIVFQTPSICVSRSGRKIAFHARTHYGQKLQYRALNVCRKPGRWKKLTEWQYQFLKCNLLSPTIYVLRTAAGSTDEPVSYGTKTWD
jgi:hypothetical protein